MGAVGEPVRGGSPDPTFNLHYMLVLYKSIRIGIEENLQIFPRHHTQSTLRPTV